MIILKQKDKYGTEIEIFGMSIGGLQVNCLWSEFSGTLGTAVLKSYVAPKCGVNYDLTWDSTHHDGPLLQFTTQVIPFNVCIERSGLDFYYTTHCKTVWSIFEVESPSFEVEVFEDTEI